MAVQDGDVRRKGRIFLWFGGACLAASAILTPVRADLIPLFHHQVTGLLLCQTMLALGLAWVAAGNIVLQKEKHRWLPVPFLLAFAFVLAREWLHVFS